MEVVLGMLFLSISNTNIKFKELERRIWRAYGIVEALPTSNQVELITKKEFAEAALDKISETFVIYVLA